MGMTGLGMMELGVGGGTNTKPPPLLWLYLNSWPTELGQVNCHRSGFWFLHLLQETNIQIIQPAPSVHSGALPSASKRMRLRLGPEICWELLKACNFAMVSWHSICSFRAPKEDCSEFLTCNTKCLKHLYTKQILVVEVHG
jgi:hypothetical protein